MIADVFREIGLADELGSGMRNTYKYTKLYSGGVPEFEEGDMFITRIPLIAAATGVKVGPDVQMKDDKVTKSQSDNSNDTLTKSMIGILREKPFTTLDEMAEKLKITKRTVQRRMNALKAAGRVVRVGSKKTGHWQIMD